jgi:hypothetical protein
MLAGGKRQLSPQEKLQDHIKKNKYKRGKEWNFSETWIVVLSRNGAQKKEN